MLPITRHTLCALAILFGVQDAHARGLVSRGPMSFGMKIVGGEPIEIEEQPWLAAIIIQVGEKSWTCGGSVIGERWILTAAHCFDKIPGDAKVEFKVDDTYFDGGD